MSFFLKYVNESPNAALQTALDDAIAAGKQEWRNLEFTGEWATGGYGVTNIRPAHVFATPYTYWGSNSGDYWASCYAASVTWEPWISDITQTELSFEVIGGWFDLEASPKTLEFYFKAVGKELPSYNLEETYAREESAAYLKSPIVIYPNKPWSFYHKGIDTGVEREGLLGWTVATQAYLILR